MTILVKDVVAVRMDCLTPENDSFAQNVDENSCEKLRKTSKFSLFSVLGPNECVLAVVVIICDSDYFVKANEKPSHLSILLAIFSICIRFFLHLE